MRRSQQHQWRAFEWENHNDVDDLYRTTNGEVLILFSLFLRDVVVCIPSRGLSERVQRSIRFDFMSEYIGKYSALRHVLHIMLLWKCNGIASSESSKPGGGEECFWLPKKSASVTTGRLFCCLVTVIQNSSEIHQAIVITWCDCWCWLYSPSAAEVGGKCSLFLWVWIQVHGFHSHGVLRRGLSHIYRRDIGCLLCNL